MSHIWISLFSLLDFDPTFESEIEPGGASMDTCVENFFQVHDNNSNDEAQLSLLEELLPGPAPGRVEDPDPGTFVESINFDFDSDPDLSHIGDRFLTILEELEELLVGVWDIGTDVLVDPVNFGESVGDALYFAEEDLWMLDLDLDYVALLDLLGDEDGGGRSGSAPAANGVVENLPLVEFGKDDLERGAGVCTICTDDFEEGEELNRLPCCHYFHRDCIVPWLRIRSTCPLCRFVLPSNDKEC